MASYPEGSFRGVPRLQFLDELGKSIPAMARVFGGIPWDSYTVLAIFDPSYGGGSALEHQNSHLGIYDPQFIGTPILPSITAHEIFHAWNVKRLRPGDLVYEGDVLGAITNPFGREVVSVRSPVNGVVLGTTTIPMVNPGDAIAHVARLDRQIHVVERFALVGSRGRPRIPLDF